MAYDDLHQTCLRREAKFVGGPPRRFKVVDDRRLDVRQQRAAVLGDELAIDEHAANVPVAKVIDFDQVGGVARPQQADVKPVMQRRVDAGHAEELKQIVPVLQAAPHKLVDMSADEIVGVLVVAAEHAVLGEAVDERRERVKVLGGRTFADEKLHAALELFEPLVVGAAFVVGADAGGDVFCQRIRRAGRGSGRRPAYCDFLRQRSWRALRGSSRRTPG